MSNITQNEQEKTLSVLAADSIINDTGIQLDITAPAAPVITFGVDGDLANILSYGDISSDSTPLLLGTAEAGSVVTIYDGNTVIGSTTVASSGEWNFTTPERTEGTHNFIVTATDAAGNTSGRSDKFVVNIDVPDNTMPDTTAPDAPVITNVFSNGDNGSSSELHSGDTTQDSGVFLRGQAEANSIVKIYDGNTLLGSVTASSSGAWV